MSENAKHPGEHMRMLLEAKGWTQEELAAVLGVTRGMVINILQGRSGVTAEMAVALAGAFSTSAEEWLKLDSDYRLSKTSECQADVAQRAKLFSFPIRDMQRRGWITDTSDPVCLETELKRFFGTDSLEKLPPFQVAMRKATCLEELTPPQRAWCFRAKQLAMALQVGPFKKSSLPGVRAKLRSCAVYVQSARQLPKLMAEAGIRFIIVEPLPGAKIDGAAFWLDEHSPVMAVSLRYDRVDAFWFTVMHEFAHIESEDSLSIDSDLAGETALPSAAKDDSERAADSHAAASLVPPAELDSFVRRVGPLYSKQRIIQFAHRIRMHPGIIVGQLQHLGEVGYSANREMLAKIRSVITEVALTDGWGRTVGLSPN